MGPNLLLLLSLFACDPDSDTADTAPVNTDTDSADTGADEPTDWWDPARTYRLPVQVMGERDLTGAPIELYLDFRSLLDEAGDPSPLQLESIAVVQRTEDSWTELPSQFLDGTRAILDKVDSDDPLGDEVGDLVVLPWSAPEGTTMTLEIYFNSLATTANLAPSIAPPPLSASDRSLSTGGTSTTYDPERGGMLWTLRFEDSPKLTSVAEAPYGNGLSTAAGEGAWRITPQDGQGELELLVGGPVVAGLRATGLRADDQGSYVYDHEYWMFAGSRALYAKVHQSTTAPTLIEHNTDFTHGIRPWQSTHQALVEAGITERHVSEDLHHGWLRSDTWGMAYALVQPPEYIVRVLNDDVVGEPRSFFGWWANDYQPEGLGTPYTLPAGVTHLDHDVLVAWPFRADETDLEHKLLDSAERPTTLAGELQRLE